MSDEARELHRIIGASVRDMLDAYRLQAQAGPVTDKALEGIVFRARRMQSCTASPRTPPHSGRRCCRTSCACSWQPSSRTWRAR
jgi:hypothetical protein